MCRAFPGADYYGSSATPRQQQRTVRLPRTPKGSAGTAGTFPTFTTDQSAGSAPSSTPEVSVALYRNTQRDPTHPNIRIGETVLNREQDRVPQQPITASFGADAVSRGF
jgi:hypothetical protein